MSEPARTIALIGGSGLSSWGGAPIASHRVSTAWGAPSGPIEERRVGNLRVLFLARHGVGHVIPPHRLNYRANIAALAQLGAERIVTVSSVGSLREELPPGSFLLPDQFVDFTKSRPTTFFDGGRVYHVSTADPFCPELARLTVEAGTAAGIPFRSGGTYVCVEGPRFSTRAESRFFRGFADIIGMTLVPEVTLAREMALCYSCLATVTDFDVWADRPVEAADIVRTMRENQDKMLKVLDRLFATLDRPRTCACSHALDMAQI
ncbi:MAG TPA: S-methyl-5'-thioadenosine phosphorylase [Thermoplasmata archaeon]|nr:S-methyl-5'-thioadenosine phosphorylase [Thermoplasmata archaeon]